MHDPDLPDPPGPSGAPVRPPEATTPAPERPLAATTPTPRTPPPTTPAATTAAAARSTANTLRWTVHTHLLPQLVAARRHLDAHDRASASAALDRAHELALSLLRDVDPTAPGDPTAKGAGDHGPVGDPDRLLLAAADRARRTHAGRLTVVATAPQGADATVDPAVAATLTALVDEAALNAARHRIDGHLHLHLAGGPEQVDVVARSTGRLHHDDEPSGDEYHGRGLHLLRRRLADVGGTLQVLHDDVATTLVATLPTAAAATDEPGPPTHDTRPTSDGR